MSAKTEKKVVLIVRKTRLDELILRYNTEAQAKFYIEHLGADFSDYQQEDAQYKKALAGARQHLEELCRVQLLDRQFVPNFIFGPEDIFVVLGQDGLVANTLKYLDGQPVLGINPDPARWEGVLLPFVVGDLPKVVPEVFRERRKFSEVTMARVQLNNGLVLHAVNDLFIGARSHISARYLIRSGKREEVHSSSGIIVSTGLGATGWYKSLMTGALAIASAMAGRTIKVPPAPAFAWNADHLRFTVREPFPSKTSAATLVVGRVTAIEPLHLVSQMAGGGVIFSDGIESDYLDFNSGATAVIRPAERKGRLVV